MHKATPYGHCVVNGRPVTDTQLASLAGASQDQIPSLLEELESAGVFSRNKDGVLYSRRMTRDDKKRRDGQKAQKQGVLPGSRRSKQRVDKTGQKSTTPGVMGEVVRGVVERPPSPQKPEARGQKQASRPAAENGNGQIVLETGREAFQAAGLDPGSWEANGRTYEPIRRWLDQGVSPDEIVTVFRKRAPSLAKARSPLGLANTLMADEVAKLRADADARAGGGGWSPPDPGAGDVQMRARLGSWFRLGLWPLDAGPNPDSPHCDAPRTLIDEVRREVCGEDA